MKTNIQKDIKIPKSGFKRSKFNWSHDVNTTFGWGEIQPTECKLLVPGSKTINNSKGLVRFAPMLVPTFGRVHYKSFSQFVPLEDVFPNFGSFMSQEPTSTAAKTAVAKKLCCAPLAHVSSWCFLGARATMYFAIPTNDGKSAQENAAYGNYITWFRQNPNAGQSQSDWRQWFDKFMTASNQAVQNEQDTWNHDSNQFLPKLDAVTIDFNKLGQMYADVFPTGTIIRLSNRETNDLCPVRRDYQPNLYGGDASIQAWQREVTMESADFVLEGHVNNNGEDVYFAFAFEFSDYGKRIRKILQGCGYQISLTSKRMVSILPLLAQYKAYFDVFGLQLYQSWETTFCNKFIKYMTNEFVNELTDFVPRTSQVYSAANDVFNLHAFMLVELADEWYTDRPDFYGAHIEKLGVSPQLDTTKFISVASDGGIQQGANLDNNNSSGTAYGGANVTQVEFNQVSEVFSNLPYIKQLQHGQVDATLLQRWTRWINKYSILGRAFDKIMRAFGLGKYLDGIDSTFISSNEHMLTISDVVSMAATADATLGEFGGKGLEYFENRKEVFENDSYGYWITLSCIVPESGYTQNIDLTLDCVDKMDMYQADFDAIGQEATTKESLVAAQSISTTHTQELVEHTFGFVPRLSKWKVHKNLVNGDFNRHGLRSVYLPYTLDKQLNINDFDVDVQDYRNPQGAVIYNFVRLNKSRRAAGLPCAGNWARTPTKYKWLGNFDRIFDKLDEKAVQESVNTDLGQFIGWSDFNRDNFMFHGIQSMTCWAPMKPIEESYGLEEEENPNQSGVEYVNKA